MTANGWLQVGLFAVLLLGGGALLGVHLTRILDGGRTIFSRVLDPLERALLRRHRQAERADRIRGALR